MAHTIDTDAARELELYACSFSGSHYNMVGKTLSKFYKQGTYSHDRAVAYVERYLLIPAAKDYKQCFAGMTDTWHGLFNKPTRVAAADAIALQFVCEFRLGNFW